MYCALILRVFSFSKAKSLGKGSVQGSPEFFLQKSSINKRKRDVGIKTSCVVSLVTKYFHSNGGNFETEKALESGSFCKIKWGWQTIFYAHICVGPNIVRCVPSWQKKYLEEGD
ncbi:hypothetical protein PHYBLDRAFT_163102 [Phycomyces blakesleeanus NRRL 1555(-)]|uniref:Uncharacterized protein n=1 Tax=Phycomyces blakesleeanus (strain ATCC 8743b / DSM 1359 / FGSC 10004 / NBRC 33097 / NRRL 1555) TaxID=763407 RepID=A0A162V552_PHYB8|nr:hypothetical protein PHYBLDRAFT_163102 [Phycomyces blakesleeanus NRRL 1555(-)]OAD80052.1 hypothetical protein PHYBLDRAFT_163102 [Phycomyces blakesleeanus NRRL 1555(-)]|eukprot:XP_018298092.1 hypothetical protein PHYBLDRAFT_163102 [Phycomyces blakesleeanus NRRL 1555(-)]